MNVFCDQGGDFGRGVADNIKEGDNVGTAGKVLEDLDLSLDFLLLHWLQNLDDALLLIDDVDALEDLTSRPFMSCADRFMVVKSRTSEYFPRPTFLTIS